MSYGLGLSEKKQARQRRNRFFKFILFIALRAALAEARQWRDKFENEIPSGPTREILDLVQERLAEGLEPDRLLSLISLAQNSQNCDAAPETKRFIVNTPIFSSPGNSVSLGDGTITVTGPAASQKCRLRFKRVSFQYPFRQAKLRDHFRHTLRFSLKTGLYVRCGTTARLPSSIRLSRPR